MEHPWAKVLFQLDSKFRLPKLRKSLGDNIMQLSIESVQTEIGRRIGRKFGLRGHKLPRLLSKLGKKLPRGLEKELTYLFDAEARTKHPKRRGQVDPRRLKAIRRSCLSELDGVDLERDRSRARALLLAELAARMLLFTVGFVGLLYWFDVL